MELIKIMFFAIGTFFGMENSQIGAEKTTVTINPNAKTITIIQENLFTLIKTEKDSLLISEQLTAILKASNETSESQKEGSKSVSFYTLGKDDLNAKIEVTYANDKDLRDYAIDRREDGGYSLIHIPSWGLGTEDGTLKGNYWNFSSDTTFEFTLEPFKEIPAEYKMYKRSLFPMWERREK